MRSFVTVEQTATVFDLTTVEAANTFLDLTSDTANDATVADDITSCSKIIAAQCNRVLALQDYIETFLLDWGEHYKVLPLKRFPVTNVASITQDDAPLDAINYDVDGDTGFLLHNSGAAFSGRRIVVTYTAGYDLPTDAPASLARACLELMKEQRAVQARSADASMIRGISHGETSVYYQSPSSSSNATALPPSIEKLIADYRLPAHA